ncbi:putative transmembrane protein [Toxoplasma gondii RUB]|uniref:Putative transmembrane protein n=1 Tax=Toxoplasma gondii RUB TaxID=935652 RepID=A0A086LYQ3_TOXGO|nr:putative transmembrane protein [Toxoplasma gondii RUB]
MRRLRARDAESLACLDSRAGERSQCRRASSLAVSFCVFSLLPLFVIRLSEASSVSPSSFVPVGEQDAVTVEEAEAPRERRRYVPRTSNPDFGREAPAIAGAPFILADDWPYIFDGVAPDGSASTVERTARQEEGETIKGENERENKCAFFVWAHSLSPRPRGIVRDKEPIDWSELWYYYLRELQRRGDFDTLVLLAPDAHNRQDESISRLHAYAAWLARKMRLMLSFLLVDGREEAAVERELNAQTPGEKQHSKQLRARATGTLDGAEAVHPRLGRKSEQEAESLWEAGGEEGRAATVAALEVPPEPQGRQPAEQRPKREDAAAPEAGGGATPAELQWLAPLASRRWRKCSSVDLFLLGKGVGGLALRLLAAPSEELWGEASTEAEEKEILLFHDFLWRHMETVAAGRAAQRPQRSRKPTVSLRSVVTVNTPHAGVAGRPFARRSSFTEWMLRHAPTMARLASGRMLSLLFGAAFLKELWHGDADRLLCTLAQQEKRAYSQRRRTGSLLALADAVLFYGALDDRVRKSPASVLGIWDPALLDSVGLDFLARHTDDHNHYRFIDVAHSPSNALGVQQPKAGDGTQQPREAEEGLQASPRNGGEGRTNAGVHPQRPVIPRYHKNLLVYDSNVCKVLPRNKLFETTLQLLELINEHQQPVPFVPLRFGRLTNHAALFVDGDIVRRRGAFYFGKPRVNFDVNKWSLMHAAVRSLQTRAAIEETEFDNDKAIPPEAWFLPTRDQTRTWT